MSANSENKLTLTHITPNSYRQLVRRWRCWATCCCTFVGHLHENRVETLPLKSVGSPTTWLSLLQRFALTRNTRTETQSTNWSNVSKSQHHTEGNNIHTEDLLTLLSCEVPHLTLRFFLTKPLLFQWPLMVLQNSCVGAAVVCCACLFFFPSSVKCHQNTTTNNSVHHTLILYLWEIWKLPFISVHPVFTTLSNYWKSSWKIHYFLSNSEKFWIKFRCELTDEIKKKKRNGNLWFVAVFFLRK